MFGLLEGDAERRSSEVCISHWGTGDAVRGQWGRGGLAQPTRGPASGGGPCPGAGSGHARRAHSLAASPSPGWAAPAFLGGLAAHGGTRLWPVASRGCQSPEPAILQLGDVS